MASLSPLDLITTLRVVLGFVVGLFIGMHAAAALFVALDGFWRRERVARLLNPDKVGFFRDAGSGGWLWDFSVPLPQEKLSEGDMRKNSFLGKTSGGGRDGSPVARRNHVGDLSPTADGSPVGRAARTHGMLSGVRSPSSVAGPFLEFCAIVGVPACRCVQRSALGPSERACISRASPSVTSGRAVAASLRLCRPGGHKALFVCPSPPFPVAPHMGSLRLALPDDMFDHSLEDTLGRVGGLAALSLVASATHKSAEASPQGNKGGRDVRCGCALGLQIRTSDRRRGNV